MIRKTVLLPGLLVITFGLVVLTSCASISQSDKETKIAAKGQQGGNSNIVNSVGWGKKSNAKIAAAYNKSWLGQTEDITVFVKTGFALYDARKYADALDVFAKMQEISKKNNDVLNVCISLIWQGHMMDLSHMRKEALSKYKEAADMKIYGEIHHDQYGLAYSPSPYALERMNTAFIRLENLDEN